MRNAVVHIMATICLLVAIPNAGYSQWEANQVGRSGYRTVDDNQQSPRFGWVPKTQRKSTSSPLREPDNERQKSLRRLYKGRLTHSLYLTPEAAQSASEIPFAKETDTEVDFTPQHIRNQGNEMKNYVVMISANWCHACRELYPMVEELRSEGYIVYVFETNREEFEDFAALYDVTRYPTLIVYDEGKEVDRAEGLVTKGWFTKRLKTKDEQKETKPKNPYEVLIHGP